MKIAFFKRIRRTCAKTFPFPKENRPTFTKKKHCQNCCTPRPRSLQVTQKRLNMQKRAHQNDPECMCQNVPKCFRARRHVQSAPSDPRAPQSAPQRPRLSLSAPGCSRTYRCVQGLAPAERQNAHPSGLGRPEQPKEKAHQNVSGRVSMSRASQAVPEHTKASHSAPGCPWAPQDVPERTDVSKG